MQQSPMTNPIELLAGGAPEQVNGFASKAGAAEQKQNFAKFTRYLEEQGRNPAEYFREQ